MTYGEVLWIAEHAVAELMHKELPVKAAMKVCVLNRQVSAALEPYNEMRKKLLEKYARRDKEGKLLYGEDGSVKLEPAFWGEINEVLAMDVSSIVEIEPIRLSELGAISVTPLALTALGALLVTENDNSAR